MGVGKSELKPETVTIRDLSNFPRWVAWNEILRSGKATKIPIDPKNGKRAKSNDPDTWAIRAKEERWWRKNQGRRTGGVGFVLGEISNIRHVVGIDLDNCIDAEGKLSKWADEIVERFATYAEVSPSGKGVKLFFQMRARDVAKARALIGEKTRKAFIAGSHCEIALDLARRYYAVTEDLIKESRAELRLVDLPDVEWLPQPVRE